MNKPAFYEKMLKSFHDRFINAPTTVREHLAAGRIEDARREAHSAKGVSASVSANHLREQALVLEKAIAAGQADVTVEIAAFSSALDEVLAGLRAQFGWPIP
jgi:two-component system, sensor histidine kinase and response regulator